MKPNGDYVKGVGYALRKLGAIPNVYNYVDAGHHGWLGWDTNFQPAADMIQDRRAGRGRAPSPTCTASSPTPPTTRR